MRKRFLSPFQEWNRNFALLAIASLLVGVFFGVQLTLFNNFIVDRLAIEPHHLGYVEALREVPGFLNFLFIALMIRLAPSRVAAVALIIMGLGIAAYSQMDSVTTLAIYSVVWSIGFHCWLPLEQTMALSYSPAGHKGRWLGQLRAVGSVGMLLAIGLCMVLLANVNYEGLFVLAGVATAAGGIVVGLSRGETPSHRRKGFLLKRRYLIFYLLNFLQGFRKQMFITFAIFALVKVHGMPVSTTIFLVLINQILLTLTATWMGRLVDRHGERRMLSLSYAGLIFVFIGYAVVQHRPSLYVLYCIDNLIFFGGIALTTYLHRIAPPEDLKSTLAMGITMNHVAAVIAPAVGGVAWYYFGYQVIFLSGAVLALLSLVVSQWVRPEAEAADRVSAMAQVPSGHKVTT